MFPVVLVMTSLGRTDDVIKLISLRSNHFCEINTHIFHFFSCKEGSRNSFSRGGVSFERFVIRYPNLTYLFLFLKEKPGKSKRLYFVA